MLARLTGINRDEALSYLGWKGGPVPEDISRELSRCEALLLQAARPRAVWQLYELQPDGTLGATGFRPEGEDIRRLLEGCGQAVLMGATLGAEVDGLIRRAQVEDMARAVILDACAGAAIENVCDNLCADLAEELRPRHLTDRFSPGYGDLPFSQQADFCRLLDLPRRVGVNLSPAGLMIPQKSVTALMGVADRPRDNHIRGCEHCQNFETCAYRKEGKRCAAN